MGNTCFLSTHHHSLGVGPPRQANSGAGNSITLPTAKSKPTLSLSNLESPLTGLGSQGDQNGSVFFTSSASNTPSSNHSSSGTPSIARTPTTPIVSDWLKGELIGSGASGCVYKGLNCEGELIAVKEITFAGTQNCILKKIAQIQSEINILKTLNHENVIHYFGAEREGNKLFIFFEYIAGGSLSSLISKFGSLPEKVVRKYTRQILLGLQYLHRNGIIHRDIKSSNILVDSCGTVKLADFGCSKVATTNAYPIGQSANELRESPRASTTTHNESEEENKVVGTLLYIAPEVLTKQAPHERKSDIWSLGCSVMEMITGAPPWWSEDANPQANLYSVINSPQPVPLPESLSPLARDFLSHCLEKDPTLRPTADELLQHPFVCDVSSSGSGSHPVLNSAAIAQQANETQSASQQQQQQQFNYWGSASPILSSSPSVSMTQRCYVRRKNSFPLTSIGFHCEYPPDSCAEDYSLASRLSFFHQHNNYNYYNSTNTNTNNNNNTNSSNVTNPCDIDRSKDQNSNNLRDSGVLSSTSASGATDACCVDGTNLAQV